MISCRAPFIALLVLAASSLGLSTAIQADDSDVEITRLDSLLERAYENLNEAGTYVCRDRLAQREYESVWSEFTQQMDEAELLLKRRPNTKIYLNSCRKRVNWAKFGASIKVARRALNESRQLLDSGKTD